jgi:diguanylate cyclase (GGDEF)-like protein
MADLDYFKQVNDNFGHLAGDKVLVAVARLIHKIARNEDLAGRFGGEEFIMILVGTDQAGGKIFAERLRQKTEQMKVPGVKTKITMSLGVTEFLPDDTTDTAIKRADEAMYMAKRAGRNQVVVI